MRKRSLYLDNKPVYDTVCSLCRGYDRREREIARGITDDYVLSTYIMLNAVIDEGLASICEHRIREQMRRDIGNEIGYRRTSLSRIMSEVTYKARKTKSIEAIARGLHLI